MHCSWPWAQHLGDVGLLCPLPAGRRPDSLQVEVVEGVAGEEDHHEEQEEHGEENAEAEGQHDEHDEDGRSPSRALACGLAPLLPVSWTAAALCRL